MKYFILVLLGLSLMACEEQRNANKSAEDLLNNGNWKLTNAEKQFKKFQSGLKFSEDNQVFDVDSQGQIVVPMHERLYSISEDTMTIVDYRYEDRFIYSRGTFIFLIEELNEDRLVLNVLHPEGPNRLEFDNLH